MKYLFILSFTFLTSFLMAQTVSESKVDLSVGTQNAYYVTVEGADKDLAEDVWKDYIDEMDAKVKRNKKAKEYYTEKVRVYSMNKGNPVDLYMKIDEGKGIVDVYVAADRGDAFVGSNDTPDDADALEKLVENYGYELQKKVTEKVIEKQEDVLKDLRKDLEKLEKKNADYHEDIRKAEEKIREAEERIADNLKEQDSKREEIEAQVQEVETVVEKYNNIGKG